MIVVEKPGIMMRQINLKDLLSKRFTLMVVPHGAGKPRQINIPISFLVIVLTVWTLITGWGSYLSARHVDYWRTQLSNQVLTLKVNYLINQLDKASGFLDQVKQLEQQLQNLIKYPDEASLIKSTLNDQPQHNGTGGPTYRDQNDVTMLLDLGRQDVSWDRLVEKVNFFKQEAESRIVVYNKLTHALEQKRRLYLSTPLGWPCSGRLTSHFGQRLDPFSGNEEFHFGVDIANTPGTTIKATAHGKVRIASWMSGYGNLVVLDHDFGYSTRYAHNSKLLVKAGDTVKRGQPIALMGMTGKANGPHSHYEVWQYMKRKNPYKYLDDTVFPNNSKAVAVSAEKTRNKKS